MNAFHNGFEIAKNTKKIKKLQDTKKRAPEYFSENENIFKNVSIFWIGNK